MTDDGITLEELSERSGVEARTLRSWIREGLLSPPYKPGRGARYPTSNIDRALAVRVLKIMYGLSLSEIGRKFMMASEEEISEWARDAQLLQSNKKGSAREYIRRARARSGIRASRSMSTSIPSPMYQACEDDIAMSCSAPLLEDLPESPHSGQDDEGAGPEELASIAKLIRHIEHLLDAPAPNRSSSTCWTHISVTPDFELCVKGDLEPRERIIFERLADQLRAILTGRTR